MTTKTPDKVEPKYTPRLQGVGRCPRKFRTPSFFTLICKLSVLGVFFTLPTQARGAVPPTMDSVAPISLSIWDACDNGAGYYVSSTAAGACSAYVLHSNPVLAYSDLGYTPISPTLGYCTQVSNQYPNNPRTLTCRAWITKDAVCPSSTPAYTFNPSNQMCERPATLTIILSGGSSIEPWHKKFDQNHTKANLPFKAIVTDQNGQAKANVGVSITSDVTQDSGGHAHTNGRPNGKLVAGTSASTLGGIATITGITDSTGTFSFTFGAEEASGEHRLTATCAGCAAPANTTVNVLIPGLTLLGVEPGSYDLQGYKDWHPGNHYFSDAAIVKIINLAHAYSHDPAFNNQLLIINDSSLSRGGVLDLEQDWSYTPNGHEGHRMGIVVDINNYRDGPNASFRKLAADFDITARWEGPTPQHPNRKPHYHVLLLGEDR